MATNFPNSLDSFTNPISANSLALPSHSELHTDLNNAMASVQAKIGVDGSSVQTSLDYRVTQLESIGGTTGVALTGDVEPVNPVNGTLFFDTATNELKVYFNNWFSVGGGISGLTTIDGGSVSTSEFDYTVNGGSPSSVTFSSVLDGGSPSDN